MQRQDQTIRIGKQEDVQTSEINFDIMNTNYADALVAYHNCLTATVTEGKVDLALLQKAQNICDEMDSVFKAMDIEKAEMGEFLDIAPAKVLEGIEITINPDNSIKATTVSTTSTASSVLSTSPENEISSTAISSTSTSSASSSSSNAIVNKGAAKAAAIREKNQRPSERIKKQMLATGLLPTDAKFKEIYDNISKPSSGMIASTVVGGLLLGPVGMAGGALVHAGVTKAAEYIPAVARFTNDMSEKANYAVSGVSEKATSAMNEVTGRATVALQTVSSYFKLPTFGFSSQSTPVAEPVLTPEQSIIRNLTPHVILMKDIEARLPEKDVLDLLILNYKIDTLIKGIIQQYPSVNALKEDLEKGTKLKSIIKINYDLDSSHIGIAGSIDAYNYEIDSLVNPIVIESGLYLPNAIRSCAVIQSGILKMSEYLIKLNAQQKDLNKLDLRLLKEQFANLAGARKKAVSEIKDILVGRLEAYFILEEVRKLIKNLKITHGELSDINPNTSVSGYDLMLTSVDFEPETICHTAFDSIFKGDKAIDEVVNEHKKLKDSLNAFLTDLVTITECVSYHSTITRASLDESIRDLLNSFEPVIEQVADQLISENAYVLPELKAFTGGQKALDAAKEKIEKDIKNAKNIMKSLISEQERAVARNKDAFDRLNRDAPFKSNFAVLAHRFEAEMIELLSKRSDLDEVVDVMHPTNIALYSTIYNRYVQMDEILKLTANYELLLRQGIESSAKEMANSALDFVTSGGGLFKPQKERNTYEEKEEEAKRIVPENIEKIGTTEKIYLKNTIRDLVLKPSNTDSKAIIESIEETLELPHMRRITHHQRHALTEVKKGVFNTNDRSKSEEMVGEIKNCIEKAKQVVKPKITRGFENNIFR